MDYYNLVVAIVNMAHSSQRGPNKLNRKDLLIEATRTLLEAKATCNKEIYIYFKIYNRIHNILQQNKSQDISTG